MKILNISMEGKSSIGSIKIMPLCSDDLYALNDVIVPGDVIEAQTTRKVSMDGGKTQHKVSLVLAIKVETIETDLDDCIMYIKGKTCKEHENVRQGSYHTLDIVLNEHFTISKNDWTDSMIRKLKEAKNEDSEMCFIIFYDKDCVVSRISQTGVKNIYKEEIKNKNYKALINSILSVKEGIKNFVIASISDVRNDFAKALLKDHKDLEKKVSVLKLTPDYKGIPNSKVISKMLVEKNFAQAFANVKYVDDLREIEGFFLDISLGKKNSCVGEKEVLEAFEYGALKTLFITDSFYRPGTVEERKKNSSIIQQAHNFRAKVCIIPVSHEHGQRLKSMGHIAGVLQFDYK